MDLEQCRTEIDRVDDAILRLFEERMALSAQVAEAKAVSGLPVEHMGRERGILARITRQSSPDIARYSRVLFSTLFELSKSYQRQKRPGKTGSDLGDMLEAARQNPPAFPPSAVVACQGVEGAYAQLACDKLFRTPDILYFRSFEGVFSAVEQGLCQFGVLPVENSSAGSVTAVYDLMRRFRFTIVRSVKLRVDHCLLTKPGIKPEDIQEIYSHEQALTQCDAFLKSFPHIKVRMVENTAAAAEMVSTSSRTDIAAISAKECARLYGLQVMQEGIQNAKDNFTRFFCIAKAPAISQDADTVSLMLTVPHVPGSLGRLLSRFAALDLNLIKLESRPIPDSHFEFMFYFDLAASVADPAVKVLLEDLSKELDTFAFLGNYKEIS